jgi:ABC-type multidrug transport system fused ATPase/permease subunit
MRANSIVFLDLLENFKKDKSAAIPQPDPNFKFNETVTLKKVSFNYPETDKAAIHDIDLTVKKGENVGIIGASGSGKSTLALILTALVKPTTGEFLIDEKELTPESRESYFDVLGYVSQSPLILDGTIAENIAFKDYGDTYDMDRLKASAKMAALDFIDELPEGLETHLSSAGATLSGGQIQRIAIARALYNNPQILVLDEATSSLDILSEATVRKSLQDVKDKTTTVVIAHRLSTVEFCDRLIWLEDGKVRMEGPPSSILSLYSNELKKKEL